MKGRSCWVRWVVWDGVIVTVIPSLRGRRSLRFLVLEINLYNIDSTKQFTINSVEASSEGSSILLIHYDYVIYLGYSYASHSQ